MSNEEDPRLCPVMAELEIICSDGNSDVRCVALAVLRIADAHDPERPECGCDEGRSCHWPHCRKTGGGLGHHP